MNEKIEIYKHIYKDSNMSVSSLKKLKEELKDKDNKIKDSLDDLINNFKEYEDYSKKVLKKCDASIEKEGFFAKMMANIGIKKEVDEDNSDSHMAEVLIQGIVMGSLNMEKKISSYHDKLDSKDLDYANKFLEYEQKSIELLKEYL